MTEATVQIVEVKFWAFLVESTRLQQELEGPFAKREFCFALSYTMCNIQVKATYGNWSQFDITLAPEGFFSVAKLQLWAAKPQ